eukprot:GILJ01006843.1.p1 GENE.GILJ01006843.1~~GILJ01006843.1.p1  ORF type:complete len:402 (+),score=40.61 GILJ01006843.1:225-1430(+)
MTTSCFESGGSVRPRLRTLAQMEDLPSVTLLLCFEYLHFKDLGRCGSVSRLWWTAVREQSLWYTCYIQQWPVHFKDLSFSHDDELRWRELFQDHIHLPRGAHRVAAHKDEVLFLAFSHSGKFLASSSRDGLVKLWPFPLMLPDLQVSSFDFGVGIGRIAWSPVDSHLLVSTLDNENSPLAAVKIYVIDLIQHQICHSVACTPYDCCGSWLDSSRFICGLSLSIQSDDCFVQTFCVTALDGSTSTTSLTFNNRNFAHLLQANPFSDTDVLCYLTGSNMHHTDEIRLVDLVYLGVTKMETVLTEIGAVIGFQFLSDGEHLIANVRPYLQFYANGHDVTDNEASPGVSLPRYSNEFGSYRPLHSQSFRGTGSAEIKELSEYVELHLWNFKTRQLLSVFNGHKVE